MKKQFTLICLGLLLFSSFTNSLTEWKEKVDLTVLDPAMAGEIVEFIVIFEDQADVQKSELFRTKEDKGRYVFEQLQAIAHNTQMQSIRILKSENAPYQTFWIVNSIWTKGDLKLIQQLAKLNEVKGIHPNPSVKLDEPDYRADQNNHNPVAVEWGLTTTGADLAWAMGYKGQNVVIGGQDTGVEWDHAAIKEQYRGWDGTTATHDYNWHDAIHTASGNPCGTDSTVPCDDHGHGTHTVGTMSGDDGGSNQIGMAPDAKWIACRNMDEGDGTPITYIECFQWFLAPTDIAGNNPDPSKAPHVINNSWGCPASEGCNPGNFAMMETAVNNLRAAGVVVVVSAGNSGSGCSSVNTPAAIFSGSFSVGATNSSDNIAGFSSRGPVTVDGSNRMKPDVSAPGVSVRSCIRNGNYAAWSGTSMAGPHVAGAVALMISADPSIAGNVSLIESTLMSSAIARTTSQTCGGVAGSTIPNNTYGYGRIDALGAINALMALPVELTDFYAVPKTKTVDLFWTTAAEYQNDYFSIERSNNLEDWSVIGSLSSLSANNGPASYQFEDTTPFKGSNYYRLRQVDYNTDYEYSKVVVANIASVANKVRVYPNPVLEELTINFGEQGSVKGQVQVVNMTGQLIFSENIAADLTTWTASSALWSKGVYFLTILSENGKVNATHKLMKL